MIKLKGREEIKKETNHKIGSNKILEIDLSSLVDTIMIMTPTQFQLIPLSRLLLVSSRLHEPLMKCKECN